MKQVFTERTILRFNQLLAGLYNASPYDYYDRLRAYKEYCEQVPALAQCLSSLPEAYYDFQIDWREIESNWPGGAASYATRWSAIKQLVEPGPKGVSLAWDQMPDKGKTLIHTRIVEMFVQPLHDFLLDNVAASGTLLYLLLRFTRWAEWFESVQLRTLYEEDGEDGLDISLRQFLFESGIDYPYSQPASPGGEADIVAQLETDDPLVLEVKVWDSNKGYRDNRIRDGIRQVMDYAIKYGKDRGYVIVFNLDAIPLVFVGQSPGEWPARIELGDRTYFFIAVHIGGQKAPVSQRDKGKLVAVHEVRLADLLQEG
jgi:hypothetical protein